MERFSGMNRIGVISLLLAALAAPPAFAGTTGVLRGQIADEATRRPIAGATVVAESPQAVAKTTSDADGNYVFMDLTPGLYTVSVQARGFEPISIAQVPVQADRAQILAIADPRELKTITDRCYPCRGRNSLVQRGIGSDVYIIYTPSMNGSSVPARTPADELRFVPGVQAGPGLSVPHG